MNNNQYPFINTPLPYAFQALEPYIDATTMYLHHEKHLQTYIDNLNKLLAKEPKLQACTLEELTQMPGDIGRNSGAYTITGFILKVFNLQRKSRTLNCMRKLKANSRALKHFRKFLSRRHCLYLAQDMRGWYGKEECFELLQRQIRTFHA